jgi:hypothetical protein
LRGRGGARETLHTLLVWVLPSANNLQFPYLEGGECNRQTKDYHYLKRNQLPLHLPLPQRKLVETKALKSTKLKKGNDERER